MKIEKITVYEKDKETRDGRQFKSVFTYIDKEPHSVRFTRMSGTPANYPAVITNVECKTEINDRGFKRLIVFAFEENYEKR